MDLPAIILKKMELSILVLLIDRFLGQHPENQPSIRISNR